MTAVAPEKTSAHVVDRTVEEDPRRRAPLVIGDNDFASVTEKVSRIAEVPRPPRAWYVAFAISAPLALSFFGLIGYLVTTGVGVWGNNQPVAWAFDSQLRVWIGIGHAAR